jgi:hypothetical protein
MTVVAWRSAGMTGGADGVEGMMDLGWEVGGWSLQQLSSSSVDVDEKMDRSRWTILSCAFISDKMAMTDWLNKGLRQYQGGIWSGYHGWSVQVQLDSSYTVRLTSNAPKISGLSSQHVLGIFSSELLHALAPVVTKYTQHWIWLGSYCGSRTKKPAKFLQTIFSELTTTTYNKLHL